jgi:hypothetical protein
LTNISLSIKMKASNTARKRRVFISAPISLKWETVKDFITVAEKAGADVRYWERGTPYQNGDLDNSDDVVFLLPKNLFKCSQEELPLGLKNELARAYAMGKTLYVGYVPSGRPATIYAADTNGKWIKGIAGTSDVFLENVKASNSKKDKKTRNELEAVADSIWTRNPCAEITLSEEECILPRAKKVYASTVPNPDYVNIYVDERLILML